MAKFFFYTFIGGLLLSVIAGFIGVSNNSEEISLRKELGEAIPGHIEIKNEFFNFMKEKGISTDSLLYYYDEVCYCNKDSIVISKMTKSSNVVLSQDDLKKAYSSIVKFRKSEYELFSLWTKHVSSVEVVKNWVDEDRGIISIEEILIGIKDSEEIAETDE